MTVLRDLRAATRADHERLERELDVPARCGAPPAYAALLRAFHAVYAPLEAALAEAPATAAVLPDWRERRKADWLAADLAALGSPLPPPAPVPVVAGAADVVGVAYVVEGATLGGAVLLRDLESTALPRRFFTSYGARRGAMWHAFRSAAEQFGADGGDVAGAVVAARGTFAAFTSAGRREAVPA